MMTGFGMGFGALGLLVMLLFWGGLIFGAVWLARAILQGGSAQPAARGSDHDQGAREILARRYARGEITAEQYASMKQDLEA